MGCIYGIRNEVNHKWYIGKCSGDAEKTRKHDHFRGYGNKPLYSAIKKYGAEKFSFHFLLDGVLPEFLNMYEIEYIAKYNSVAPNGYNLTLGGEGVKASDETRRKIIVPIIFLLLESVDGAKPHPRPEITNRRAIAFAC